MKKLLSYFLQGLLYLVPISVTIYIVIEAIRFVDGIIPVDIPGLGLLIILIIVTVVGFIGRTLLTRQILNFDKI